MLVSFVISFSTRKIILLGAMFLISHAAWAQDQAIADSLEAIYEQGNYIPENRLDILKKITENHPDPEKKIIRSRELIDLAMRLDSVEYIFAGNLQMAQALRLKGDPAESLKYSLEAAGIAENRLGKRELGISKVATADAYSLMENHARALRYYHEAIDLLEVARDSVNIASALLNAGDEYFNKGDLDSALVYFEKSGKIFEAIDYELGLAYNLGNIGLVYAEKGDNVQAENNMYKAVNLMDKAGNFSAISTYLTFMSDIYMDKGEPELALGFSEQSLDLAKTYGLKNQISEANLKLAELNEKAGNIDRSYDYFKDYVLYRDSVRNLSAVEEMASLRADYEVLQKQAEVDLLNAKQKNQRLIIFSVGVVSLLVGLLAFGLYRRNLFINRTRKVIEEEKNRSDNLLLNILPAETAGELKSNGRVQAKKYDSVSVMFADFTNFTRLAEYLSPEKLIQTVDHYFSHFDMIMEKHGIEKIKTIGDCYMAASGLPFPTENHTKKIVLAAFEMAEFVEETQRNNTRDEFTFSVRIGIHTGPVVAGVVGTKKFAYDIWGDTVNIASRMESYSSRGKINISGSTYELIKDEYECEYRGEMEVKNKGYLKMYYVYQKEMALRNSV